MVLDGAMNGIAFLAYVGQVLVQPTLVPGDSVVMDNLPAHKAKVRARHSKRWDADCSIPRQRQSCPEHREG
jgi:hypothetical protein